jgi:beta-lactam-binding protein with PASTA domain
VAALKLRVAHDPAPPIDPDLAPAPLADFIAAGLSPDPANRPQTAAEFAKELALLRDQHSAPQSESPHGPQGPPLVATGAHAPVDPIVVNRASHQRPDRSAAFAAAMGLIAVGLVGLIALVASSAIGDGEQTTTVTLPSPAGAAAVADDGETGLAANDEFGSPTDQTSVPASTTTTLLSARSTTVATTLVAEARVPNLVGLSVDEATAAATGVDLRVLVVSRVAAGSPDGRVIEQKPDAGATVTLPATVTLFIPRASTLPVMVGRSANSVCAELQALSLACRRVTSYDETVPAGMVIATSPATGAPLTEGGSVEVTVSRGPVSQRTIPQVAGLTQSEARTALEGAGFVNIGVATRPSERFDAGLVSGTTPEAATTLPGDRRIVLLVSSGPPSTVAVPRLKGSTAQEARAALLELGLNTVIERRDLPAGDERIGTVVVVRPEAGTEVATGVEVTIVVGREASGSTTTVQSATSTSTTLTSTTSTSTTGGQASTTASPTTSPSTTATTATTATTTTTTTTSTTAG